MEEINQVNEEVETTEQVETEAHQTVSKADYDALKAQLEELQGKIPKEPTDAEINLKKREKELFDKEVNLTLKENGFGQFTPLIKVQNTDELDNAIKLLQEIYKQNKVNSSYIPSGSTSTTQYEEAQAKKDAQGMISAKLSKLFGK
ncbi:hypothetical protein [Rummeliibacillus sp. POC4]|uniref:hypothetical protein n=1 Tax=Rummeliibacillus sp. POC4 TaxID=2305899 RepID=UPI000E662389|nr:hypothetical protein [Rummeliibacillus sp. POC4]RIJ65316.1 hypothetical protein D1606_08315 [Rummeliibacillus sp. POC4]